MNEKEFRNQLLDKNPTSWYLSVLKDPNNTKNPYAKSMKILTNNFKYYKIDNIIQYWQNVNVKEIENKLNEENWMYVYCLFYGFRKGLLEKDINIYFNKRKKTPERAKHHLLSLDPMTDEEISHFLSNSPITINNNKIINGFHRACAMAGRLIRNEKYIRMC